MRAALVILALLVAGCSMNRDGGGAAAPAVTLDALVGSDWVAEDVGGRGVAAGVQSTLHFDSTSRVSGRGGCNQYNGTLSGTATALQITQLATTRAACPPREMDQEIRFLINLAKSTRVAVAGDHLVLSGADGTILLRFRRLTGPNAATE